ncbi:MAG: CDP-alcohol phosphatidyltransferase family protein [Sulfitobacter sp.]
MKARMIPEATLHRAPKPDRLSNPASVFGVVAAGLLLGVAVLSELAFSAPLLPILLFLAISGLCLRGLMSHYPHTKLGSCNIVTLLRAALVSVLAGAIFAPAPAWAVFFIAVLAFLSDGADGWLARRSGLSSDFGARFDMEMDALLGAVLALVLLGHGLVGFGILVLGFTRYVFVLAGLIWPALRRDLPENYRRKTICVFQIAALILLVFPLTPSAVAPLITSVAAGLLLYSFAVDAWALMRRGA